VRAYNALKASNYVIKPKAFQFLFGDFKEYKLKQAAAKVIVAAVWKKHQSAFPSCGSSNK